MPRITYSRSSPRPEVIRAARERADLSQAVAAMMLHVTLTQWGRWEAGSHAMPLAMFEHFLVLTDQHPKLVLRPRVL